MRWTLMQKVMLVGGIGILVVVLTAAWRLFYRLSAANPPGAGEWEAWIWNLLLTSSVLLLFVVLAVAMVRRQVVLPIRDLVRAANESAERGLNRPIPVTGTAEIGDLQRAFNELIGDMRAQQTALRQRNHELQASLDEQRQSEERYRRLVELSPDPVLVYSEGRLVYCNPAGTSVLGATRPEDLLGRPITEFMPADLKTVVAEQIPIWEKGPRDLPLTEIRLQRLDGQIFDAEVTATGIIYLDSPARLVVFRDITARKKVDRLKNEFISTVSHELRTPLTSIRGGLGLVIGGVTGEIPPRALDMLTIAYGNSERLVRLINDILDISKIEAGETGFHLERLELMPLLEQALEANRAYAAHYGVQLVLQHALPDAWVLADPDRLSQVLANLLSNASKFSPAGSTVRLAVTRRADAIRIAVTDEGPGIPVEFQDRIFQKFAQADSSDSRQKGGTGLGLSIVKAIVERLGGQVGYEIAAEHGTTFYVDLPAQPPGPLLSDPQMPVVAELLAEVAI